MQNSQFLNRTMQNTQNLVRLLCGLSYLNKGRFCNTIALKTKEIFSSRNSKQTKPRNCSETCTANSRLVRAKEGFQEKVCAYNERRRVNLKLCLADFVYLIQELRNDCLYLSNNMQVF